MKVAGLDRIVNQRLQESAAGLVEGQFDFVIVGASWDRRCLSITESPSARYGEVRLLRYIPAMASSSEEANLAALLRYFTPLADHVVTRAVNSRELVAGWAELRADMLQCALQAGRPINILVDLNSIPRYWTLGLLAFASRSRVTRAFSVIYAGAGSYAVATDLGDEYSFTSGEWAPVTVPGLGRPTGAAATSHLVVSGGFEGRKTRRLVHDLEPDRLSILLANSSEYHLQTARRANAGMAADYGIDKGDVVATELMDFRNLLVGISDLVGSPHGDGTPEEAEQLSFLLAGPKLASFAMGVSALDMRVAQVYYVAPERRNVASSASPGNYLYCALRV